MTLQRKKTFLYYKNTEFLKSKNVNFFVDVDLVKIRLDIMLSDFPQEQRNLLDYKKTEFFKVEKVVFFSKGFNPLQAFD